MMIIGVALLAALAAILLDAGLASLPSHQGLR